MEEGLNNKFILRVGLLGMAEDLIFGCISEQWLYNLKIQLYVNTITIMIFRSASFRISYSANNYQTQFDFSSSVCPTTGREEEEEINKNWK